MEKRHTLVLLALCCLLASGCKRQAELFYDESEYAVEISGFGYSNAITVENCVIFDAAKLSAYEGWKIIKLRIFNPEQNHAVSYTPEVYRAAAGAAAPAALASRNAAASEITSLNWKTIQLDTPVTIEAGMDYWAGYRVIAQEGQYPLAVGEEESYGNSRNSIGSGFGLVNYNWVLRIVVEK